MVNKFLKRFEQYCQLCNFDIPKYVQELIWDFRSQFSYSFQEDSKIIIHVILELLLHLQLFNISTHHKKCKRANNHNKSILKSIPDVKECSLSLFAVFYWISDGGLERKSNSLTVSLFFCVTMCLLTAIFPCFHFIFPLIWLCLCFI